MQPNALRTGHKRHVDSRLISLERRNGWMWGLTAGLLIMQGLAIALLFLPVGKETQQLLWVPGTQGILISSLTGLTVLFCLYIFDRQSELKRLRSAIEDDRVYTESLHARLSEIAELWGVLAHMNPKLDPRDYLAILSERLLEALTADGVCFYKLDGEGNELICEATASEGDEIATEGRISAREGIPGWVLKHREALVLDRGEQEAQFSRPIPVGGDWNSVLCIPLINDLDPTGILWVWRGKNERTFSLEDALIVKRFGEQVAKDLSRSADYMELDRKADHLEGANRRLSELDNVKRIFFSTVNNEIRTPLAGISYHAGLLSGASGKMTDEAKNKHLWSLTEEIVRLSDFVNEITDLLALESEMGTLQQETIQLNELIQDCVLSCTPTAAQKGVVILTELEADLPPISADKKKVHQAIHYLLTHAVRDSVKNGTIRIATDSKTTGQAEPIVSLVVADEEIESKPGDDELPTSLGCYLVKDLIEQVGGTVEVNEPHSRLTMSFPAQTATVGEPDQITSRKAA